MEKNNIKRIVITFVLDNDYMINSSVKMKDQKNKEKVVEKMPEVKFTINEDLNKYRGPEFEPPKLKGIREKFSKGIIIHR